MSTSSTNSPTNCPTVTYDHQAIEQRWQDFWAEKHLFQQTEQQEINKEREKLYLLFAFAYPSGSGLHVGHVESKTALDILARYSRMNGRKVFFPVGWDAFGLPAENYAIKTGVHPEETTHQAIETFSRQIKRVGISYDWANEIATCHPEYYRWTQWLFLELFKAGLAYRDTGSVNWCPSCQTVLANEQVVEGLCERCDSQIEQKEMKQWYFRITDYQDELIEGLDEVDWPESTKRQQLNWIGKQKGAEITFSVTTADGVTAANDQAEKLPELTCFTTRPDTVFGTTFLVISPEKYRQFNLQEFTPCDKQNQVETYLESAFQKTEEERQIGEKDKTGVETGLVAINPVNQEKVPVFVADYVLAGYGTGVVMGVPAHDERDFAFALKHNLKIKPVIDWPEREDFTYDDQTWQPQYAEYGVMINSGKFNGLSFTEAMKRLPAAFPELIKAATTYKLRDWLISRQRYWGAPIPIVYDPEGQPHPVKEEHLPWELPTDIDFKPTGESPLRSSREFKERTERLYGEGWRPEYDTMDTFVDSSWYFLRYVSARNQEEFADPQQLKKWLPVDFYMIGPEHTVLHLLYSRFFTKFLRDQAYLNFSEPFLKMRHQGMILGPDGKKMSKSKGNVINPDEVVEEYGADTLRLYEMFMGPIEADKPWDTSAVAGVYRFLKRVNLLVQTDLASLAENDLTRNKKSEEKLSNDQDKLYSESTKATAVKSQAVVRKLHQAIRKVSEDIPELKFNTAIAFLMELVNDWSSEQQESELPVMNIQQLLKFLQILAPFAPFLTEELYSKLKVEAQVPGLEIASSIHLTTWPDWDKELAQEELISLPVQINGKVRAELEIPHDQINDEEAVLAAARKLEAVQTKLAGQQAVKEIYVPGRIISLVVK